MTFQLFNGWRLIFIGEVTMFFVPEILCLPWCESSGLQEHMTSQFIQDVLKSLGIPFTAGAACHECCWCLLHQRRGWYSIYNYIGRLMIANFWGNVLVVLFVFFFCSSLSWWSNLTISVVQPLEADLASFPWLITLCCPLAREVGLSDS